MTDPTVSEQDAVTLVDEDEAAATATAELVEDDLLIEDVSIDGMCGVY